MRNNNLCKANIAVGRDLRNFMVHVPDIKEESITDYLVWKWRELDSRFNYLSARTFTRNEEHSVTGADFELELWLVGDTRSIPLLFQAKKFVKPFNSYVRKFNYPNNTQQQLTTLQTYASTNRLLPFYLIYSLASPKIDAACRFFYGQEIGPYMLSAREAQKFADGLHGKKLSLEKILASAKPFHCVFCCLLGLSRRYFEYYFQIDISAVVRSSDDLPSYVNQTLTSEDVSILEQWPEKLERVRALGVYDLRKVE